MSAGHTLPAKITHELAWQEPFEYEARMYVTTTDNLEITPGFFNTSALVWQSGPQSISQRRLRLEKHLNISIPDSMLTENRTNLYAMLFVQQAGQSRSHPDTSDPYLAFAYASLTKSRQRVADKKHSLLAGKGNGDAGSAEGSEDGGIEEDAWVPHAKSRVHWEIVLDDVKFPGWTIPRDILPYFRVTTNTTHGKQPYTPMLWENQLAARRDHWRPLTSKNAISKDSPMEVKTVGVDISFSAVSIGWFRLCNLAFQGTSELSSPRALIRYSESDVDNLREMVYEVNPTMLGITAVAMAFHLLFSFLAYKEDMVFWSGKNSTNMQGISRSSLLMGVASSWISFLYMWDRRHETNIVVLLGALVGALVEGWKATKVIRIADLLPFGRKQPSERGSGKEVVPTREMGLKERVQHEVDQQTMWYMLHVCIPAMVVYVAFSLVYQHHESYVSWFLNTSLIAVYLLEFVYMWPQLLINHRLKTVDMLPLASFLYHFLTTFIDDLYAFVVPMPLLERIGTLRDDIVFFVLCYQWCKFPRRTSADVEDASAAAASSSDTHDTKRKAQSAEKSKKAEKQKVAAKSGQHKI
ncbi:Cleft lip and palate associated transmembrane protein 1 [Coemansia sp. RSA 1939]|nr:Cleft lip and palate associated transmembrane protein 1 [Coemansia sp. RSA 1939]KAJ2607443.1 Cleft lip and palate associated transmembrane protein 1 [Coemansia sp. RSA 1804]